MCCVDYSGCPSSLMPFTVPIRLQVSDTQVLEWCTLCLALASGFWALFVGQVTYVQMCCVRSSGCPSGLMRFTVPIRPEVPDTHVRRCTFCLVLFWVLGCVFEASCVPMCCAGLVCWPSVPLSPSGFWVLGCICAVGCVAMCCISSCAV